MPSDKTADTIIGILMLDTRFPRPVGDIGNPATFDHPVIYRRMAGANVSRIVTASQLDTDLIDFIISEALALQSQGASIITTSCGFLSLLQDDLQAALTVPVITSSLCILPELRKQFGDRAPIGILTFDANSLSANHIRDDGPLEIEGLLPGDHLYEVIKNDLTKLDEAESARNVTDAYNRLLARNPDIKALVLECTNLPPYRSKLLQMNGIPVFDIVSILQQR